LTPFTVLTMIANLINQFDNISSEAAEEISSVASLAQLNEFHTKFLGRKGLVAKLMGAMKDLQPEDKPKLGQKANEVKKLITGILEKKEVELQANEDTEKIKKDEIDVSLPGTPQKTGGLHPLTQTINEIIEIFVQLGFAVEEGKEIEDEWHTFDALNIPKSHPARDVQDTFFIKSSQEIDSSENQNVLRTHTSPVQIRVMQNSTPPLKFIAPGRVYRNETIDASHYSMFHQVEGLYVNENVTFAELKGTLLSWAHAYYGPEVDLRFRPSYFPFTEPSAEVDVTCTMCAGKGCSVCKQTGWVEILGAGMVHPNVFKSVGYDPEKVSGLKQFV